MKQRKRGEKVWEFRFRETDSHGTRQRRAIIVGTVTKYPTNSAAMKSDAVQRLLLRINAERPQAQLAPPLFGAVIARYEKEEMPDRYSTSAAYRTYITNYIRPRWADVPIDQIRSMICEDWLKTVALAPKSRSHIRSIMSTIFVCAARWELIDKNPMTVVRVRGATKRLEMPRILTPAQFGLLPPLIAEPYRTQVVIAGCLGLRASEIMPLKWTDFDFDGGTVLVQRSIVHGRVADVKTEYSRDCVPIDPALVEVLLEHRKEAVSTPEGWLFANPITGRPYHQDTIQQNHIRTAGKSAGLGDGIDWHTFRHSYRSWLDDTGAPMSVQKELMRHANIQTTMNVYGKAMPDSKRQANSNVVQMVLKGRKTGDAATEETPIAAIGR